MGSHWLLPAAIAKQKREISPIKKLSSEQPSQASSLMGRDDPCALSQGYWTLKGMNTRKKITVELSLDSMENRCAACADEIWQSSWRGRANWLQALCLLRFISVLRPSVWPWCELLSSFLIASFLSLCTILAETRLWAFYVTCVCFCLISSTSVSSISSSINWLKYRV